MLFSIIILRPLYRWRTGLDLLLDRALDLGPGGVIAGIVRGKSGLQPEPQGSPEADVIAAAFHNQFLRERREERGW